MRIVAEIPARIGSQRVHRKNLRLLEGKPLIAYAIEAAKQAVRLSEVYVNTDSEDIGALATGLGVQYYRRPFDLGSDTATQDQFNFDFIINVTPDVLVMVNPVAPFIEGADIDAMIARFLEQELDTLIAVKEERAHAFVGGRPINFNPQQQLPRTQDLVPVQLCAWSVAIWRAVTFVEQFRTQGFAAFSGKIGFYPLDRFKALKISTEEDFLLAEILMKHRSQSRVALAEQS